MCPSLRRSAPRLAAAAPLAMLLAAPPLAAQQQRQDDAPVQPPGSVTFPTSCAREVQSRFESGVALLHAFWFEQALQAFEDVAAADPGCAMAHWGRALTLLDNPLTRASPPPERLAAALEAAEAAASLAANATDRERGYIAALLALYRDHEAADHAVRMERYEAAMKALHERHPDDAEAAILYGLAVIANAPADELAAGRYEHAASILGPLLERQPDHPGLAHYAAHAAAHRMDLAVHAHLQAGRDAEAWRVVARAIGLPDRSYAGPTGYSLVAMPARFTLERGRWTEAADVHVPEAAPPYVEAAARFARGIGAARSGRPLQADAELEALAALEQRLNDEGDAYWSTIVGAQRLAVAAWVARMHGRNVEALRLAREAAELEETVEQHPAAPGPLLPARELEAEMLLGLGRARDALAAYEKALEHEPRRARALYGAAQAAEKAGDAERARRRYAELLEVMADADPTRPEPKRAREFLGEEAR